ncbi:hypothetical protein T439DRAFT_377015 [Meredithblackwellia eburnea MCA 4105]
MDLKGPDARHLDSPCSTTLRFAPDPHPRSGRTPSPARTLVDASSSAKEMSPNNSENSTINIAQDSDVDSIWAPDYAATAEQRLREEDELMAEAATATPYFSMGFSIPPGHSMSRLPTRQLSRSMSRLGTRQTQGRPSDGSMSRQVSTVGRSGMSEVGTMEVIQPPKGLVAKLNAHRRRMRILMRKEMFHMVMIGLVALDLMIVMAELVIALLTASCPTEAQYEWLVTALEYHPGNLHLKPENFACTFKPSHAREILEMAIFVVNVFLLSLFNIEVISSIYAFGPITFFKSWVSVMDGCIVTGTLVLDVYFHARNEPAAKSPIALVILRLWKIFRAVHAIAHALELHYHEVVEAAEAGKERLEWERIAESIRLAYVRELLVKKTGVDIEPSSVEDVVQREVEAIKAKRMEDAMARTLAPPTESGWDPRHWLSRIKH